MWENMNPPEANLNFPGAGPDLSPGIGSIAMGRLDFNPGFTPLVKTDTETPVATRFTSFTPFNFARTNTTTPPPKKKCVF